MIKRIAKRALSIILTLVLIATTFFIFDPSVLKIDSEAYANIKENTSSSPLSSQEAYAPETIYLKPGSSTFNYFCNYSTKTGAVGEAKSTSSYIYFQNSDATEVTLAVNRVYYKNGSTDKNHTGTLMLNNTTVATYAGCFATSTDFENTLDKAVATGTNTINYQITTGSLSGCAQNTTYFIEWVVRYKIDGTYHLMFMYTGVYCPSINMTAVSTYSRYTGTGSTPEMRSFALVTGAMKYSEKGNRYHAFTDSTVKTWGGTTGSGTRTAPLVSFVGYKNNSTANTIPNEDYDSTNNFPTSSTGSGKTVLVAGGSVNDEYPTYYTNFTSYGTYADPNPTGTISGDCNASGYQTGVAYLVVDTSRYSNYNQIPYLQAGFVTTYKKNGGHESVLSWIQGKPTNDVRDGNLGVSIYCSNDTGDHDEDGTNSRTYGLYQINGPIYNGGFQLAFHYRHGISLVAGTRTFKQTTAIGIHTTTVSKTNLRTYYNNALHSNIDLVNVNKSKSALSSMDYSTYYNSLKSAAETLCNPTSTDSSQHSDLNDYTTNYSKAIESATGADVYFYVPEAIYTKPLLTTAATTHYGATYVDGTINTTSNEITLNTGEQKYGNIYFHYANASSVKISYSVISSNANVSNNQIIYESSASATSGTTLYSTGYSSSAGISATGTTIQKYIINSAVYMTNAETGVWLKWTATYVDKVDGRTKTATAYTYVYKTFWVPIEAGAQYENSTGNDSNANGFSWISGIHSINSKTAGTDASMKFTKTTTSKYNIPYSYETQLGTGSNLTSSISTQLGNLYRYPFSSTDAGLYFDTSSNNDNMSPGDWMENSASSYYSALTSTANAEFASYRGGSDGILCTNSPVGNLTVDISRYTNFNQIPGLSIGFHITSHQRSENNSEWYVCDFTSQINADTNDTGLDDNVTGRQGDWGSVKNTYKGTVYASGGKGQSGFRYNAKYNRSIDSGTTMYAVKSLVYGYNGGDDAGSSSVCRIKVTQYNKKALREAYQNAINKSHYIDSNIFDTSSSCWTTYTSALEAAGKALTQVDGTITNPDTLATNLNNAVNHLMEESRTCTKNNGKSCRKTGTVTVYHRYLTSDAGDKSTSAELKAAVDGTKHVETKTYFYGDNVNTGYNETAGYSYFGYYRNVGTTQWTSPSNGALVGNAPGPNKYGSSGHNEDKYVMVPNLTYTYVYHKDNVSVCKDYGDSPQAFGSVSNLANLSSASINGSYTNWGAAGGSATISGITATGFTFSVTNVGTNSSLGLKYNDIYITNAATGLTAGGTYTLSFKSNREYDDMAWYGDEFNSAKSWAQYQDYLYTPGYLAVYVLSTTEGDKALQKVDTRFSEGGTVGTFTLASGVTSVSIIIRIYSDGTMYPGEISDFKIAEGQYVHEGFAGDTASLGNPTWTGHTFIGWTEQDSPFDGALSGTLNTSYTFGIDDDVVLANWKINSYDVMFDNEFDFDSWNFSGANGGTLTFDKETNSLTLTASSTDSYTTPYQGTSCTYMTLIPGHTYRFSYHYENGSVAGKLLPYIFSYTETDMDSLGTYNSTYWSYPKDNIAANESGTHSVTFTVPSGRPRITFRVGQTVSGMTVTYSDIYIQDLTNAAGVTDNAVNLEPKIGSTIVHGAEVLYNTAIGSATDLNGTMPTETRSGYTFAGWYNSRDSHGNGTGTKYTENTVIGASNVKLYSRWTVSVTYNANGGSYMTASYNPKDRSGLAIGTSIAVSNRIAQNSTNWNSDSMTYAYVPYRVGYNFAGWKASSIDSSVNGKTYWPGQTIEARANVTLTAQWEEAPTASLNTQYTVGTSNNGKTFYPGQMYFYSFTPSANMYVSGYTNNRGDNDPYVYFYTGTTLTDSNDDYIDEPIYGLTDIEDDDGYNSIVTAGLASGTKYYYGIKLSGSNYSTTTLGFKLVEHTVSYTLNANGGSVSPTTTTATGNYNKETSLPTPTKTGYTFANWKASDNSKTYTTSVPAADNSSRITGNTASLVKAVTLTAQWNINQYAVNVYAQYNKASSATAKTTTYERDTNGVGGTVKVGSSTAGASATANIDYQSTTTIVAAAKTGYSFQGWYASPTLSGTTVTAWGTQYSSSASVTVKVEDAKAYSYYAKFEINTYTIGVYAYHNTAAADGTFTKGTVGGTVGFTSSVGSKGTTRTNVHGQSVTIYAKPNTGYEFVGWYYDDTSAMSGSATITRDACTLSGGVYSYSWTTTDSRSYSAKFAIYKYTLTVAPNKGSYGGSTSNTTVKQYYGTTYTLSTPIRTGYTFKGWTLTLTEGGTAKGSITNNVYTFGAGNDTAKANWAIDNYKITVDPNGGSCSNVQYYTGDGSKEDGTLTQSGSFTASKEFPMAYGTTASITPPTRTGYTFTGWTKTAGSGTLTNGSPVTTANATFKVTTSTATLKAGWQINQYKLTVKAYSNTAAAPTTFANNATGGTVKIGSGTAGATVTADINYNATASITAAAETGYRFVGWQTDVPTSSNSVSSTSNPFTTAAMGTSGLTYYARFEIYSYTVSVSAAYSSASAPNTYTAGTTGGTVSGGGTKYYGTQASLSATANKGYEFVGWYSSTTATTATSPDNPYTPTVTGNITLVGKFRIKQFNVSVQAYGNNADETGTFIQDVGGTVSGGGKVYYNLTATLKATPADGYAFAGWYTSTTFTGDPVSTDEEFKPIITQDITYYAKFTVKSSTITVYAYGNSAAATGTYKQGVGGLVNVDGAPSGTTASNTFNYGAQYTIRAYPSTGYKFIGWYTDTTFTTEATEGAYELGGAYQDYYYRRFNKQDKAETVYAKFDIQGYTLTVNAFSNTGGALGTYQNNTTGGTVSIGNNYATGITGNGTKTATAKIYYGASASITATPATGYNFAGWYTTSALSGTAVSTSATFTTAVMTTDGLTYYAKFSVGSITITYNANGGTSGTVTSGTAYYNTAYAIPATANPTKTGFEFLGWSTSQTATSAEYQSGTQIPAATINSWYPSGKTLYAVWKATSFTATIAAAYNTYADQSTYKIGTTGGTATLSKTLVNATENLASNITYTPATGYKFSQWRYSQTGSIPTQGNTVSINWGTVGTSETQMPTSEVKIIVYFSIGDFDVYAYAYSNNASKTGTYTNNAAGGTVKVSGTDGTAGATAKTTATYTANVTFVAAVSTGYRFDGWFTDSALTKSAGSTASLTVTVGDSVKDTSLNKYFAKFSILSYTAYGSARYYSKGVDSATGAGLIGTKGGTVKLSNNNSTWVTASGSDKASVSAYYTATVYYSASANTGYEFIGWYSGDDADIFTAAVLATTLNYNTTMPAGNIDIHAKFTPYNFTLTLNPNGGASGATVSITLTYDASVKIPSDGIPTKVGYNFLGWSDTPGGTVNTVYNGTVPYATVNSWFSTTDLYNSEKIIYAVWEEAIYTVTLDHQNGTSSTQITVKVGSAMPAITAPTYSGFTFGGYYINEGGKGEQYYTSDAKSAMNWNIRGDATLYAKWTCPVLADVTYKDGTWIYEYVDESGKGTTMVTSTEMFDTLDEITDNAPDNTKEMTSVDTADTVYTDTSEKADTAVSKMKGRLEKINLNHYTQKALSELLNCVNVTNTEQKLSKLSQPQANLELAKMAYNIELAISSNKKTETKTPSIKIYETASKLTNIKSDTITNAADSANGSTYTFPSETRATSYTFAGKYSYTKGGAVNYYLYTNSATPVVAIELEDGEVGTTVANNNSSYPTNAVVTDNSSELSYVGGTASSDNDTYTKSAVKATDDITTAWFYTYTQAGIGIEHDYNAKTVIYLTPTFSSSGTRNEIVYTITPTDDAYTVNEGVASAELAESTTALKTNYSSYGYSVSNQDEITVCICYHNSMNGTSDNGGNVNDPYIQLYPDQVDADTWLNQMHLFRSSGGASNWELPMTGESVYPIADKDYASTGYVLGSFMYVFDSTNEPTATSYAEAGNLDGAKNAIINSIKSNPSEAELAISNKSNERNINSASSGGLGFAKLDGWSINFYPKQGSYVYGHLIDRWGNVFNKVWKCFNVDSYASTLTGSLDSVGYDLFEDGGSNLDTVTLNGAQTQFLLDDNSTYEDGVFTTTGGSFSVDTGAADKKYSIVITDKAGNKTTSNVTTDSNGVLTLNVEDACADLTSGAYTFDFNGTQVNLYAGNAKIIRSASITSTSIVGTQSVATVVTDSQAIKVQLVENSATRTFTKDSNGVTVTENSDGTLTWTISFKLTSLGEHTFNLKVRTLSAWEDSDIELSTKIVKPDPDAQEALKSVTSPTAKAGVKPQAKVRVAEGTDAVRFIYEDGSTITYLRNEDNIVSTVDSVETWLVTLPTRGIATEVSYNVIARYNGAWQKDNVKVSTVTFYKEAAADAVIYSVKADASEVKVGTNVTFNILTNAETNKVQYVYPSGGTYTFTPDNATVTDLGDGTEMWTVTVRHMSLGEIPASFRARSTTQWIDIQTFGSVSVTR